MLLRQLGLDSLDKSGGRTASRHVGNYRASRAFWLSLMLLLPLLLALLCIDVATHLSPDQLTDSLRSLSSPRIHPTASAPRRSESQLPAGTVTTRGDTAGVSLAPTIVPKSGDRAVIWYGDRLKIMFFESLGVRVGANAAETDQDVSTIFPRMDLSGEYTVDADGMVNTPRLGQFLTTGKTPTALQSDLAETFKHVFGRTTDVNVAIVERQPVRVLGTVRNAGAYKYTPGMSVLQALADAGGVDSATVDTSKAIENIRETERLHQTEDKLDHLLVKQARLIAQRENADNIVLPANINSRLSDATGNQKLNAMIAVAAATLRAERNSYQQQLSLAERQVDIVRTELDAQNTRAAQLKDLLATKTKRLAELQVIAAHGSLPQYRLTDANVEIAELVARQEDLRVELAKAERRLIEAETTRVNMELAHSAEIDKQLATTQEDIDDSTYAIASMEAVTKLLRNSLPGVADRSLSAGGFRIMRQTGEGFSIVQATETTLLLPGDVVQVGSVNRLAALAPDMAQPIQDPNN